MKTQSAPSQGTITSDQWPVVTIGLPVYQGEEFLAEAINCLLGQTYRNLEIIISDNCSTDRTQQICEEFAQSDHRITYSRTATNIGAAGNFNRVARMTNGTFFAWANHDDLWDSTYVEKCVEVLLREPSVVLAYAKSAKIDENGDTILKLNADLGLNAAKPVNRLRRYHDLFADVDRRKAWGKEAIEGFWIPVYGVMRTDILLKTRLIGDYISSDTILVEDLMMLGAFNEVDDILFFKRDHQKRSMRDSEAYDARAEWFTGKQPTRLLFPRWRALRERLRSAVVLPDGLGNKTACTSEMLLFYVRRRSEGNALVKELIANLGRMFLGAQRGAQIFRKW
ncbi:MAG: glycosyltransferase family 2 protein [Paracoccaceae bacterium]